MPDIHDLPLETIEHILTSAYPFDWYDYNGKRARRHFYLDTSLVCRDWTSFAQRALWRFVDVDEAGVTLLVESGGAGRYPIDKLVLHFVDSDTSLEPLGTLLSSVRGVRDLKLERCSMVGSWLSGDYWRDLKSLRLGDTMVASTELPAYHFALTHLALQYADEDLSDETLVALSRQLTITSLDLYLCRSAVEVLHHLLPLAPQLVRLHLDMLDDDDAAVPQIVDPFLKQCTRLKHLTFSAEHTPSTNHVPAPLKSWTLFECDEANVALILDVLNSKATAVSKLERLRIPLTEASDVIDAVCEARSWDGWVELEEVCRQKKIRLSVMWYGQERVITMLAYVSSFALIGFGARCYQLALMKRNIFSNLGGHALSVTAFTGLGYYLYHADIRQTAQIADKKAQLIRMREREVTLGGGEEEESHH